MLIRFFSFKNLIFVFEGNWRYNERDSINFSGGWRNSEALCVFQYKENTVMRICTHIYMFKSKFRSKLCFLSQSNRVAMQLYHVGFFKIKFWSNYFSSQNTWIFLFCSITVFFDNFTHLYHKCVKKIPLKTTRISNCCT